MLSSSYTVQSSLKVLKLFSLMPQAVWPRISDNHVILIASETCGPCLVMIVVTRCWVILKVLGLSVGILPRVMILKTQVTNQWWWLLHSTYFLERVLLVGSGCKHMCLVVHRVSTRLAGILGRTTALRFDLAASRNRSLSETVELQARTVGWRLWPLYASSHF